MISASDRSRGNSALLYILAFPVAALINTAFWYPYTDKVINIYDSYENILDGFYVAHHWLAYSDFASNHFPGVFIYLGFFQALFGLGHLTPSMDTMIYSMKVSTFATIFFQLICLIFTLNLFRITTNWLLIASISFLTYFISIHWNTYLPLSETFHLYLFMCWPKLLYDAFLSEDKPKRIIAALTLTFFFPAISVWFGLTSAPTTLETSLIGLSLLVINRKYVSDTFRTCKSKIVILFALLLSLIVATLATCDLEKLYYYNFPFNHQLGLSPFSNLIAAPAEQLAYISLDACFRTWPWMFFVLIVGFTISIRKKIKLPDFRVSSFLAFAFFLFFGFWLFSWRQTTDYKTMGLWGANIGMSFLLLEWIYEQFKNQLNDLLRFFKPFAWDKKINLLFYFVVGISGFISLFTFSRPVQTTNFARNILFDSANVCRFSDQGEGCRCVRETSWLPLFFLSNDVRQCKGWGLWNPLVANDRFQKIELSVKNGRTAYILANEEQLKYFQFPEEISKIIKSEYHCSKVSDDKTPYPYSFCTP